MKLIENGLHIFPAVFTGWLSDRYPLRILVLIGATLAMIGFVMSAFAPNIYVVIIGYGVVTGIFDSDVQVIESK